MKTMLKFVCIAFMAFTFAACSNNTPEKVAVNFAKAFYTGNPEKATEYCTEESQKVVALISGMMESQLEEMQKTHPDIKLVSTELASDGNSAKVKLEISNYIDGKSGEIRKKAHKETVRLKKVDDQWKVAMSK